MWGVVRIVSVVAVVLALGAGSSAARSTVATVGVYPSGTTFAASGAAPGRAATSVSLAMPIGGVDDSTILVSGAQNVAIASPTIASPLQLKLFFAHYVSVNGTPVPDALLPWDGSQRATEKANQPLWLQVTVPAGTTAGTYSGSVVVVADGSRRTVPLSVTVSPVTLPATNQVSGSLLTAFNFSPQSYGAKVMALYGVTADQSLPGLFNFLASYRISPNNWGYGNPNSGKGYTHSRKWWLDKSGQMVSAAGEPSQFSSMWIPVSNNRWSPSTYVGGQSPFKPQKWCGYLRSVRGFWQKHGWLSSYPYLWGMDEPGATRFKVVQRATQNLRLINAARHRGKQIWAYTYDASSHSTPGFTATEPLSDPRLFVDWTALEGITGLLYGQGTTTYSKGNPLEQNDKEKGSFVLVYPGRNGPIASARLEVLREGIEDWEILNVARHKYSNAAVVRVLSGLFSTTSGGAELGCTVGCQLKTTTKYSWPTWSRDANTPAVVAQMRAAALVAAS